MVARAVRGVWVWPGCPDRVGLGGDIGWDRPGGHCGAGCFGYNGHRLLGYMAGSGTGRAIPRPLRDEAEIPR